MYIIYIIISVFVLLICILFFVPLTLDIKINKQGHNLKKSNSEIIVDQNKTSNTITILILRYIPVFKINIDKFKIKIKDEEDLKKSKKSGKKLDINLSLQAFLKLIINDNNDEFKELKQKTKEYIDKIYIQKLGFNFGFNTGDYLKNAYINASLNSIICLYINYRRKNFNFNRLYYQIYVSDYIYYLDLSSIIRVKLADTIAISLRTALFMKKNLIIDKKKERELEWNNTQ